MALAYDPRSFKPFRQSVQHLLAKVNPLLISVQQCADVVGRINELANLQYRAQEAVLHPDSEWTPEEITRRQEQLDRWNKEIEGLHSQFLKTEREICIFLGDLQNVLNVLPIEPQQLRYIRSEIERLEIWTNARKRLLGMRPSYADLLAVRQRLGEMLQYLSQAQEATQEHPSPLPPAAPIAQAEQSGRRERGPDIETSRKRIELEDKLIGELGAIALRIERDSTLDELKKTYPDFAVWQILSEQEQEELLTELFYPKAYARQLVMRKFGLRSPDTLKKDRKKLSRTAK